MKNFRTFFLFCFTLLPNLLLSQGRYIDNPNLDQIPKYLRDNYVPQKIMATIETVDGYDNFNLGVDFAEGHVSVNPRNPLQFFTAFNTNKVHYTLDGLNWINSTPAFGNTMSGDPVTAYDSLGNLYYQNMYGSTIVGALVIKSSNNGQTWTSPGVVSVSGNDKNWIAADQTAGPYANYVYATMTNTSAGGGAFWRSTDFGATFQQTRIFSPHSLPGMMVAVGPNVLNGNDISGGCVYVVTNSGSSQAATYTFFVSNDGGVTFSTKSSVNFANYVGTFVGGRNSVQNMRTRPYPFIAADNSYGPFRGRLYLVYASNNPAGDGNKPDIFCRFSTDQGASWSSPVIVNDDPNSQTNHQFMPAIWCDKQSGRLFVQWMDTRDVPTSDSCLIYATFSDNGGLSFMANKKVSNKKFKIDCASCGGGGTPRYQGDYNAIVSNGITSMPIWGDFRYNSFASFSAYFPDFAVTLPNNQLSVLNNNDSVFTYVNIPDVKHWDKTTRFTYAISPQPANGTIIVKFSPDSLTSYPSSAKVIIKTENYVTLGNYTVFIVAQGPNGTPKHSRPVQLNVTGNPLCNGIKIQPGWNIVSVPRVAGSMLSNDIFPTRASAIYGYNQNYYTADTLKSSQGYWVKFDNPENVSVCGAAVASRDINLSAGWNLIGPFELPAPVANISTNPPGIISSGFYYYNAGYQLADTLFPGKGYWIKSSQSGVIPLSSAALAKNIQNNIVKTTKDLPYLLITDKAGSTSKLFFDKSRNNFSEFELPPVPPAGIFDVRFSSNLLVESPNKENLQFNISNATYPVRIIVHGIDLNLKDNISGRLIDKKLKSGDEFILENKNINSFSIKADINTIGFSLEQNYPNPFNPMTNITFKISEDTKVALNIYDILGNKVANLIDDELKSGNYKVEFNGTEFASGIYFYELKTNAFSITRKMQLIK